MSDAPQARDVPALRAEHDALAARLESRPSVDEARKGLIVAFLAVLGAGTCGALAWDRYGPLRPGFVRTLPPGGPFFLLLAGVITATLAVIATVVLVRARRLNRVEAALAARMLELRRELELEP